MHKCKASTPPAMQEPDSVDVKVLARPCRIADYGLIMVASQTWQRLYLPWGWKHLIAWQHLDQKVFVALAGCAYCGRGKRDEAKLNINIHRTSILTGRMHEKITLIGAKLKNSSTE